MIDDTRPVGGADDGVGGTDRGTVGETDADPDEWALDQDDDSRRASDDAPETDSDAGSERDSDAGSERITDTGTVPRDRSEPTGPRDGPGGREVVVPLSLYKVVTVFSTLIAVVTFFLGFVLLDAATLEVSVLRRLVETVLASAGVDLAEGTVTAALAVLGLGLIGFGSAVYVFGTRFRARGMGKPQEGSGEDSDNG